LLDVTAVAIATVVIANSIAAAVRLAFSNVFKEPLLFDVSAHYFDSTSPFPMMPPCDDMEEEVIIRESQPESSVEDTVYIETGIFVSLFNCSNSSHALFIRSLTNAECRVVDNISVFFRAFAVAVPLNYSKTPQKFVAGVPYKFKTVYRSIIAHELADEAPYNIVDSYYDIAVLKPEDKTVKHPCVYGAFVEQDESFCTFQVTEKPNLNYYGKATIRIHANQVTNHSCYRQDSALLLTTRAGFNKEGRLFPCLASLSSVCRKGDFASIPLRDLPPVEFVNSTAKELKVQLIIGGTDHADLQVPLISNYDILRLGGLEYLTSVDEAISFFCEVLRRKYPRDTTNQSVLSKVESFVENRGIRANDRHTLIWAGMHEGASLPTCHDLMKILLGGNCNPFN